MNEYPLNTFKSFNFSLALTEGSISTVSDPGKALWKNLSMLILPAKAMSGEI